MAKTNTRKYLIYGSIAAIVGVIGYYIWKDSKKPEEKPKDDGVVDDGGLKDGQQDDKGSGGSTPTPTEQPLKSENAIRKFQYYVINTKGDKTILGTGGESGYGDDGQWGDKTKAAWDKYGADYKKSFPKKNPSESDPALGITTQNKLNFNKLVASYPKGTLSQTPSGIRIWTLKFHEVVVGKTFDVWKIDLYEQTTLKDKKTQYAIKDEANRTIQIGYYSNLGKNMEATGGLHAPFKPDPQTNLAKSISAVLKMGAIQKWL